MMEASTLCSDCGICCDGGLFSSVALDAAGLVAAREERLPMVETESGFRLALPCAALRGVLCGIYERRPECCADYECELLLRVADDGLSLEEAREVIEETRATHGRVRAVVGRTPWWAANRSASDAARDNPAWAQDNAELIADLKRLEQLVRMHFWG